MKRQLGIAYKPTMALRDYLASRRTEIETQIKALRAELAEISVAEAAINGAVSNQAPSARSARGVSRLRPGSIKDWIMRVLEEHEAGLETDEVIAAVKRAGGPDVSRNSMTPQLSRLKAANMIDQQGRRWIIDYLSDGPKEEVDLDEPEEPEAAPQAAPPVAAVPAPQSKALMPPWLVPAKPEGQF